MIRRQLDTVQSCSFGTCWHNCKEFREGFGVVLEPVQQPRERVVGRGEGRIELHARGLRTTDRAWGGDEELDVGFIGAAWRVHTPIIA